MISIDRLIRSKRKTIAIVLEPDGRLTVRAPQDLPRERIEQLVQQKAGWISSRREQMRRAAPPAPHAPPAYRPGESFYYLGTAYPLEIVERARPELALEDGRFRLARPAEGRAAAVFEAWYRREARRYLAERIEVLAAAHGYAVKSLRITAARTRWGSCGAGGSLNFTWRLVLAPPEVIDYVILHELAHIEIRNHSSRFWDKVRQMDPHYARHRRWLRDNGWIMK